MAPDKKYYQIELNPQACFLSQDRMHSGYLLRVCQYKPSVPFPCFISAFASHVQQTAGSHLSHDILGPEAVFSTSHIPQPTAAQAPECITPSDYTVGCTDVLLVLNPRTPRIRRWRWSVTAVPGRTKVLRWRRSPLCPTCTGS